jgi:hypothetical protein
MQALALSTCKAQFSRMSARDREFEDQESKDRQFEDLLRRAAEAWKNSRSPAEGKGTEAGAQKRDSDT